MSALKKQKLSHDEDDQLTVTLGQDGCLSSKLGFGCMGITAFYGDPMEDEEAMKLLRAVYDAGYRHFDTAEVYRSGDVMKPDEKTKWNESIVGQFLKTVPRETFTVATKLHPFLRSCSITEATNEAVDGSLKRLGLDYIDLYYCHRMPKTLEGLEEFMKAAKALVEAGKIRHIGLSEVSAEWLAKACAIHPVASIQMEWSLLSRDLEKEVIPACARLGVGVVAYSPLARNLLATETKEAPKDWRASVPRFSKENLTENQKLFAEIKAMAETKKATPAQLSLAWLYQKAAQHKVTLVPIPGTTKVKHAKSNWDALKLVGTLSEEEMEKLEQLGAMVKGQRGSEGYMGKTFHAQK